MSSFYSPNHQPTHPSTHPPTPSLITTTTPRHTRSHREMGQIRRASAARSSSRGPQHRCFHRSRLQADHQRRRKYPRGPPHAQCAPTAQDTHCICAGGVQDDNKLYTCPYAPEGHHMYRIYSSTIILALSDSNRPTPLPYEAPIWLSFDRLNLLKVAIE